MMKFNFLIICVFSVTYAFTQEKDSVSLNLGIMYQNLNSKVEGRNLCDSIVGLSGWQANSFKYENQFQFRQEFKKSNIVSQKVFLFGSIREINLNVNDSMSYVIKFSFGKITEEYFVQNNLYNGFYSTYYDNGSLRSFIEYMEGKKIGTAYTYHKKGWLKYVNIYQDGTRIKSVLYNKKGLIKEEKTY